MASWTTRQGSPVITEPGEDAWAVYLESSGMTHLVDSFAGEVLLFLAGVTRTDQEILEHARTHGADDSITVETLTEQWLRPLEETGLVEEV